MVRPMFILHPHLSVLPPESPTPPQVKEDGSVISNSSLAPPRLSSWWSRKKPPKQQVASSAKYVHISVISGGTVTTPGLTCTAESWLATLDCEATAVG